MNSSFNFLYNKFRSEKKTQFIERINYLLIIYINNYFLRYRDISISIFIISGGI